MNYAAKISTIEEIIFNASYGNLNALKFKSIDRIDLELEKIRETITEDACEFWCAASERFEEIYNVSPSFLKMEIKKLNLN